MSLDIGKYPEGQITPGLGYLHSTLLICLMGKLGPSDSQGRPWKAFPVTPCQSGSVFKTVFLNFAAFSPHPRSRHGFLPLPFCSNFILSRALLPLSSASLGDLQSPTSIQQKSWTLAKRPVCFPSRAPGTVQTLCVRFHRVTERLLLLTPCLLC